MEYLGVILSEHSVQSTWVRNEVDIAMKQQIRGKRIKVLPLVIDDCVLPGFLEDKVYADFRDPQRYQEELGKVLHRVLSESKARLEASHTITNSICMEFVRIPAGTFKMGSHKSNKAVRDWERPAHQVTISQPFYLEKYPVTQGQWQAVMSTTIHDQQKKSIENVGTKGVGESYPMYYVSWDDAQQFIRNLNEAENEKKGILYRLPTEAEWEYACRAGSDTLYHFGDDASELNIYAWYHKNSGGMTHPVGEKKPNAWGLYDMHGNVWEWVQDWLDKTYYQNSPSADPIGPNAGIYRVIRGGGWFSPERLPRSANRHWEPPDSWFAHLGFRVACSVPSK